MDGYTITLDIIVFQLTLFLHFVGWSDLLVLESMTSHEFLNWHTTMFYQNGIPIMMLFRKVSLAAVQLNHNTQGNSSCVQDQFGYTQKVRQTHEHGRNC